jgi:2-isopropylmalate synthase
VLEQIKTLESQGFTYEGAEASVELMLRRTHPAYVPPFELIDYMVNVQQRRKRGLNGRSHRQGARRAPSACTRSPKAMVPSTPWTARCGGAGGCLSAAGSIKLVDYKVRIIDGENATAATTRVLIDTRNRATNRWSTVGASANIIEASWQALADSMEYALLGS